MRARTANSTKNKGAIATPRHEPNSSGAPTKNSMMAPSEARYSQTSWSIRVPCPGGRAASTVGCGKRVPSAAPPFCTSAGLGSLVSGVLTGNDTGAVTLEMLEILIENVLFVVSDSGRAKANAL